MNLVDKRHNLKYHYDCVITQFTEQDLKNNTVGTLRHRIKEQQSILVNVRKRMSELRGLEKKEIRKKGCLAFLKRFMHLFSCYALSPTKKAKRGIVQLRKNKSILNANISTMLYEADYQQRQEIDAWWKANIDLLNGCFLKKSMNRFKVIGFDLLNKQYSIKKSKYYQSRKCLKQRLREIFQHLKALDAKIKLSTSVDDECFIQALMFKGVHGEDILKEFAMFNQNKNVYTIINTDKSCSSAQSSQG